MRQAPLQTQIRLYNLRMVEEEEKSVPVQAAPSKSVLETVIAFDYPFVKVPMEQTRRVFRNYQRLLEKDLGQMTNLSALQKADLETLRNTVFDLQKKLTMEEDQQVEGRLYRGECAKRLKFLSQAIEDEATGKEWEQLRIDRFINEYLLSKGLFGTADMLAQQTSLASRSFSDATFFRSIKRIEERLGEGSTTECLQWCHENRAHLKKQGSPLEFHLRRQTFVELARRRELVQAIAYGKKFLTPWSDQFGREIEQLTALLAVGPGTGVRIYKYLYDPDRWLDLQALFRREVLELHALPAAPQLISTLQAGLSAMKTPNCSNQADANVNCPVCMPPYSDLAQGLPFSHHENSAIVCRISGALMDENNPPMVLPNGHVYSRDSLERLAALDGTLQCPRTGATYSLSQARKVFIM